MENKNLNNFLNWSKSSQNEAGTNTSQFYLLIIGDWWEIWNLNYLSIIGNCKRILNLDIPVDDMIAEKKLYVNTGKDYEDIIGSDVSASDSPF